jgi:hypothetical protein
LQIDEDEWEQAVRRANGDSNLAGKDETYAEISSTVEIAETLIEMWFKHQAETGDTTRTVEAFRDYCKTVLFSAEGEGVHVSSVHRYKGDQDAVTFLLRGVPATDKDGEPTVMDPFMRPFVVEQSPESAIEQCNVVYVASSRSKDMNIRVTVLGEDAEPVGPTLDRAFGIIRDSAQYVSIGLGEMDAFLVDAQGFTRVDPLTYKERHIGDFCRECVYEYPLGDEHAQNASIRVYSSISLHTSPGTSASVHKSRGKGRDAIRCLVVNEEGWPIEKFTRTHRVKNWRLNLLRKYEPSIKGESTVIRDSIEYEVITEPPHQGFVSTEQQLSCFQGFLETDYATLVERFGEPLTDSYDGKTQAEWVIRIIDQPIMSRVATIYDYKEYDTPVEEITEWHIGGFNPIVAPLVREIVQEVA